MGTDPWVIGRHHEQSASDNDRKNRGAFYTPRSVVEGLLALAIADSSGLPSSILDPTCGGGAFLIGALDRLVALGVEPADALQRVWGIDIDPGAVEASTAAMRAWAEQHNVTMDHESVHIGDALAGLPRGVPRPDLVVGNPPFATPLRGTVFPATATNYRNDRSELFGPYIDLAGLHLFCAVGLCDGHPGAKVAFVLPQSILAARDATGMRHNLDEVASLRAVWATDLPLFEASVKVCAVVLEVVLEVAADEAPEPVLVATGGDVEVTSTQPVGNPWATYGACALGAPVVELGSATLGERVSATAGFRDEYYALADACREATAEEQAQLSGPGTKIITVGSLDPLVCWWGRRPTRFAKEKWDYPIVDHERLASNERMKAWLEGQLQPKILLPTQCKVFEPVLDRDGSMAPVTPVLAVRADAQDLNHLAALFLAPPIVAWAYARWFGAALSVSAIKVAAKDIASFPLPLDTDRWDEAAEMVGQCDEQPMGQRSDFVELIADCMNKAYGADTEVFEWWVKRYR